MNQIMANWIPVQIDTSPILPHDEGSVSIAKEWEGKIGKARESESLL